MDFRRSVCAFAIVLACQPGAETHTRRTPSPDLSVAQWAQPAASPVAGTCRLSGVSPRPIVVSRRTSIVLLRASDGKELCTLVTVEESIETMLDVEMTRDGKTVYFSDGGLGHCGSVYAIGTGGGAIREIARGGYAPALDPTGNLLAYDRSHACGDRRHRMIVRDLRTGSEREWIGTWEGGYGSPVWGPDARLLLVPRAGFDASRYFRLDTRGAGSLDGTAWPPQGERRRPLGALIFHRLEFRSREPSYDQARAPSHSASSIPTFQGPSPIRS